MWCEVFLNEAFVLVFLSVVPNYRAYVVNQITRSVNGVLNQYIENSNRLKEKFMNPISPANGFPPTPTFDNEIVVNEDNVEQAGTDVEREKFTNSGSNSVFRGTGSGFNVFENTAGADNNTYIGGTGPDNVIIEGGFGNRAYTGNGDSGDIVIDRGESTTFYTGGGDDVASMSGKNSYAFAGTGEDQMWDNGTNNYLLGEGGNDEITITAEAVNSTVDAGDGDDVVNSTGDHTVYMGDGNDTLNAENADGAAFDGGTGENDVLNLDMPYFITTGSFHQQVGDGNQLTIRRTIGSELIDVKNFETINFSNGTVLTWNAESKSFDFEPGFQPV